VELTFQNTWLIDLGGYYADIAAGFQAKSGLTGGLKPKRVKLFFSF